MLHATLVNCWLNVFYDKLIGFIYLLHVIICCDMQKQYVSLKINNNKFPELEGELKLHKKFLFIVWVRCMITDYLTVLNLLWWFSLLALTALLVLHSYSEVLFCVILHKLSIGQGS